MSTSEIRALARSLLDLCKARRLTIATAESCTGGLVAGALTEIAGSSAVVMCGFVTYSNDAKHELLGVKEDTLLNFGAVSKETALAMATGGLKRARTDLVVSITGIAGPGGATPGKPVGLVHFGAAARDGRVLHLEKRFGAIGRSVVRQRSVIEALKLLTELARGPKSKKPTKLVPVGRAGRRVARKVRKVLTRRRPGRP
jgi:nicotinamide-nucleotide amidase